MSVTVKLKAEMGDSFLEVRGRRPKNATVVLYKIQNQGCKDAFWPWAADGKGFYDTERLRMDRELKRCLMAQEPYEEHAGGKHRVYTIDGDVATIIQIHDTRRRAGPPLFDNLFSQFETVKKELEMAKNIAEKPLLVSATDFPATKLHETGIREVNFLCKMIAKEDAESPAPEVYDRLLEENEQFQEKHGRLEKALSKRISQLQKAVDLVEKCRKLGGYLG